MLSAAAHPPRLAFAPIVDGASPRRSSTRERAAAGPALFRLRQAGSAARDRSRTARSPFRAAGAGSRSRPHGRRTPRGPLFGRRVVPPQFLQRHPDAIRNRRPCGVEVLEPAHVIDEAASIVIADPVNMRTGAHGPEKPLVADELRKRVRFDEGPGGWQVPDRGIASPARSGPWRVC